MQPASAVIVLLTGSIARMRFMRPMASTMPAKPISGTEPPTRPVLPPCGTIGMPASAQMPTTAAVSAVLAGRTSIAARPSQSPRSSFKRGAISAGSVVQPFSPTAALMRAKALSNRAGLVASFMRMI